MDKKDIYEHLANIYLDASTKKKKKSREPARFKYLLFASLAAAVILTAIFAIYLPKTKKILTDSQVALVLQSEVSKINFHFDPAKKEIYSVQLNKLNMGKFKTLAFSIKKSNYSDIISIKIEFANNLKEKSEIYLRNISHKWQEYKITLADFKSITNWSNMTNLSFIVEEWNAKEKQDVVYIDNIRLLR